MSQQKSGVPRGGSSYTPPHRRADAPTPKKTGALGGSGIAIVGMSVLLALVVGVGWWLTQNQATPATPTTAPIVSVWDYSSATLNSISVQSITATTTVEYQGDRWNLTAPEQAEANELTVESIAGNMKNLIAQSKVATPGDLAQYGLASPSITVTVVLSGITPPDQRLFIGSANVDGTSYYVKSANSADVFLVSNATIEPIRSWLTTPPKAEPTPTPLPTSVDTPTVTPTGTATSTPDPALATMTPIPTSAVITDTNTDATTVPAPSTPTP